MKTIKSRHLALILPTLLFIVFTSLLLMSKLSDEVYLGLLVITLAAGFALFFSDRLIEMNLKEGKFLLSEARATNEATRELALATLEFVDASMEGVVTFEFDEESYLQKRSNLERLCNIE